MWNLANLIDFNPRVSISRVQIKPPKTKCTLRLITRNTASERKVIITDEMVPVEEGFVSGSIFQGNHPDEVSRVRKIPKPDFIRKNGMASRERRSVEVAFSPRGAAKGVRRQGA